MLPSNSPHPANPSAPQHTLLLAAACRAPDWPAAMHALPPGSLRHTEKLLQGMHLVATETAPAQALTPPHERVLARACGLVAAGQAVPDGLLPWAAWQRAQTIGEADARASAWGWVTPCHWAMGREHAHLHDPEALGLDEQDARSLLQAMQTYFLEDGLQLHYHRPNAWWVQGPLLHQLPTAAYSNAIGLSVKPWLPSHPTLRRLQNEMQMLLYTHPVNERRVQQGLLPVNSIWFSGTGDLPETCSNLPNAPQQSINVERSLAQAAWANNWPAYAAAWQTWDTHQAAALLARQQAGEVVQLTLCSEHQSLSFATARKGWQAKLKRWLPPAPLLEQLEKILPAQ